MSYQAIFRNSDHELISNKEIGIRISILQGSPDGKDVYIETHTPVTNSNGLITIEIGTGTVIRGDFSDMDWSTGPYFLKTETDPEGGTNYSLTGTSQLLSVPYALYAKTVESIVEADPVFAASAAGGITASNISYWNSKQEHLTAGTGINISNNVISTTDGKSYWEVKDTNMYSTVTGNVGIGTAQPGAKLDVAGAIWQTGTGYSVFLGEEAGLSDDRNYHNNVFVGYQAGRTNTTGYLNTATGNKALFSNLHGYRNTATGYQALYSNNNGHDNTANGYSALYSNSVGINNSGTGYYALYANVTGNNNTASGSGALKSNIAGNNNTATGYWALYHNVDGDDNTADGYGALANNTSGQQNTAVGYYSLLGNTTSSNNTAVGYQALRSNSGDDNTANGYQALYSNSGTNNTACGYQAIYSNQGDLNAAFGYQVLHDNTTGERNTAIGSLALYHNTTGKHNTAVGYQSLYNNSSSGHYNTAIGYQALINNTTGVSNTAVGYQSLQKNISGFGNVSIGPGTLYLNTSGFNNTATGMWALTHNTTGIGNTALGYHAFYDGEDYENSTAIGYYAVITASNQVRIGNSDVTSIGGFAAWSNLSDGRFKSAVKKDVPGLRFILKLNPVTYHVDMDALRSFLGTADSEQLPDNKELQEAAGVQTGFIAQEVEQAAKEIGFEFHGVDKPGSKNDYYSLRYAEFVVPLVKAVQEQQEIIENQQKEIDELKTLVNRLLQR